MVFPGRLSTGCKLCRRRKVKCDEAKPSCNRCAIYGQPCPGYGDNFQFRPQEAKIKKAVSSSLSRASESRAGSTPRAKIRQDSGASISSDSDGYSFPATVATQARDGFEEVVFKQESPAERVVPQRPVLNLKTWQPEHQFFVTQTVPPLPPPPRPPPQQQQGLRRRHQQHQNQHQNQQHHRHRSQKQMQLARTQPQNLELNFASSYEQWLDAPLPSPPPTQCREQQSLCYFMNRFVARTVSAPFPGHLSFLYDLYDGSNMTSLEMATLSTAEMTAYNKFGIPELKQRAYRHRGAALRGLSAALSSPDRNVRFNDKTIGTVLLLGTFADISGEGPIRDGAHVTGLHYLLEQRGKEQLTSKSGAEIFFLGVMKLHIHAFVTNDYSYADPGGYSMLMQDVDPVWRARALVCKIPRLRGALSDHLHAMANKYQLETTSNHGSPVSPPAREQSSSPPSDKSASPERIPPLQAEDVQQIMTLYMGCMKVLGELSEWDQDITRSPAFNPDIAEVGSSSAILSPISPLTAEEPLKQQQLHHPRPNRYDNRTACTVILLKSTRVMLLLSLLAYLKSLKDWVLAYPRLIGDPAASLLLAAMFSSASASAPNVEKMLDDVRESVGEIERCVPFAVGSERDDLDGIASFQEGSGMGHDSTTTLSSNQIEVAAAALIIMHPLILVAMCPYSTPQQKQMSIDVLHRMDKNMGIRAARHRLRELAESETRGLFF